MRPILRLDISGTGLASLVFIGAGSGQLHSLHPQRHHQLNMGELAGKLHVSLTFKVLCDHLTDR